MTDYLSSNLNLIVDFPAASNSKKSVRINPMSHMRTFRQAEHESETKAYSKSDYKRFNELRSHDIFKYSDLVAQRMSSGERLTKDEVCACTGLETILSPNVPRRLKKIMKAREAHVDRVLSAQEHGFDADGIARVSMKSSRSAVARSHHVAVASYVVCLWKLQKRLCTTYVFVTFNLNPKSNVNVIKSRVSAMYQV